MQSAASQALSQTGQELQIPASLGGGYSMDWEPYTRESGATMIFDSPSRLAYHHDQALMSILAPDYEY